MISNHKFKYLSKFGHLWLCVEDKGRKRQDKREKKNVSGQLNGGQVRKTFKASLKVKKRITNKFINKMCIQKKMSTLCLM